MTKNRGKKLSTATRKRMMIEAMEQTLYNVSAATRHTGVSRTQHYKWFKDDPEYRAKIEESIEVSLDFAESQLRKLIAKGSFRAIKFHLESKGRHRGWGVHKNSRNYNYQPQPQPKDMFEQMTDEELKKWIKENGG